MQINKKILILIFSILTALSSLILANVVINFIDYGKKTTIERIYSIAESVRDGLIAHMVLDKMDQSDMFLNNMIQHQNVTELRVLRSKKIIDTYGEGEIESYKYDDIEKKVLSNGTPITKIIKNEDETAVRVTIPYIASKYTNPNCMRCHTNAKDGEVLGAITVKVDAKDIRANVIKIIFKIILITAIFLVIAFFISRYFVKPYIKLFNDLEEGISRAYKGDFSYHIKTQVSDDAANVAKRLNDLSEIFRFKKTIETDIDKMKIYERIAYILEHNFNIKEFLIFENSNITKKRKIVYKSAFASYIDSNEMQRSKHTCRAFRTNNTTVSTDFHKICDLCFREEKENICLPFTVSEEFSLTLLIYTDSKDELEKVKELIPIITNYFEIAEPVLQTKSLMDKLNEKSLKDPMTKLYNRRFFTEYTETKITENTKFSLMMVDIDLFKSVNDTYGHDIGDKVIIEVANVFKKVLKGSDLAIRFGGEEFVLITFNTTVADAQKIANNIRKEFSKIVFTTPTESFSKTLSIGIANYPDDSSNVEEVLKFADLALYNAKESGRDKVVIFHPKMNQEEKK